MIRSKNIEDYFEANLEEFKPDSPLTFDVHLYFTRNRHIMIWRKKGERLSTDFIQKYLDRGAKKVWVHRDDTEAYHRYFNPQVFEAEDASLPEAPTAPARLDLQADPLPESEPEKEAKPEPRTRQGAYIAAVMQSTTLDSDQKQAILAETAKALLQQAGAARTKPDQARRNAAARQAIQDVLDSIASQAESNVSEIWRLCDVDPDLQHAVNVATYSVIFAMAFGRIDSDLLADIAMAGLLHDVGLSQVNASLVATPWKLMSEEDLAAYSEHVLLGTELIAEFSPEIPERVHAIIGQHHEKFDGSGYPNRLQGFKLDDIGQLVAMADLLDAVSSGQWDGKSRTLTQTIETLKKLESRRSFPEYFNPEVFSAVMSWIKNTPADSSLGSAVQVVGSRARQLVSRPRR